MIEVDFKDRVPTHVGRVKLTPVSGQENTFDMVRADDPTVEGTPIDKATFDSIIQSRLTGRYYLPTVTRTILSSQTGITATPTPLGSWVYQYGGMIGTSGSWQVESNSISGAGNNPGNIFDGIEGSRWQSASETASWVKVSMGTHIKINKFRVNVENHGKFSGLQMQGSNNGENWEVLCGLTPGDYEYTIPNPKEYLYYRLYFTSLEAANTTVYEWQITEYDIATIQNDYVVEEFPTIITDHQRFTIVMPTVDTIGVIKNTLNGRNIDIILQPNKRYELVSSWDGNYYAREM